MGNLFFLRFPSKIKAWHLHKKMTLNYVAAFGKIKLVLYDDRKGSKFWKIEEIILSNDNHFNYDSRFGMVFVQPIII